DFTTSATSSMYGLSRSSSKYSPTCSRRTDGANGRNDSRNLILRFITDCIAGDRASAMIDRPPSARGPNSIRPCSNPITLPSASKAQMLHAGLVVRKLRHLEHHLLGDVLDGSRQIHLALRQRALRLTRPATEEAVEAVPGHPQPVRVLEVLHVHPQASVVADLDEVIFNRRDVSRLAVRREAHHLVLARIHAKTAKICERGIQQAERVRESLLAQQLEIPTPPPAHR